MAPRQREELLANEHAPEDEDPGVLHEEMFHRCGCC